MLKEPDVSGLVLYSKNKGMVQNDGANKKTGWKYIGV